MPITFVTLPDGTRVPLMPTTVEAMAGVPPTTDARAEALEKLRTLRNSEVAIDPSTHRFIEGDIVNCGALDAFTDLKFEDRPWLALVTAVDRGDPGDDMIVQWYDSRGKKQSRGWFAGADAVMVEPWLPEGEAAPAQNPERELPDWAKPR